MGLLSLFSPATARLVAGVSLVSLGVGFGSGWVVRGWLADTKESKVELAAAKNDLVRVNTANAAVAKADAENREVVVRYVVKTRYIAASAAQVKEDIRDAESQADAAGQPRADLSTRWVRLYNEALAPGGGNDSPAGGTAGAPGGAGDASSSGLDQWDVLSVHAENGRRWSECRAQVNALIDTFTKDGQSAVVTP